MKLADGAGEPLEELVNRRAQSRRFYYRDFSRSFRPGGDEPIGDLRAGPEQYV